MLYLLLWYLAIVPSAFFALITLKIGASKEPLISSSNMTAEASLFIASLIKSAPLKFSPLNATNSSPLLIVLESIETALILISVFRLTSLASTALIIFFKRNPF